MTCQEKHHRRGSMYVMTLGATTAVAVIGLAAVTSLRIQRRSVQGLMNFTEARLYAQSAIDLGLSTINTDTNWRSTPSGAWHTDALLGRGTYSLEVIDPLDGDFLDDTDDHLFATGTGSVGEARYRLVAELQPYGPRGMDSLASAIHARNMFTANSTVTVDAPISTNSIANITPTGVVNGDLEAVNTITISGTLNGTATQGAPVKEMPATDVLDYYVGVATAIDIAAVPGQLIEDVVLSPGSNPYGASVDANGIYVINCQSLDIVIQNCRIEGTLILLDPGPASKVAASIHWEPALPNYPSLMVRGNFTLEFTQDALDEGLRGVNFNPDGSPYPGPDDTDTDTDDVYPGIMKGLVYVSGDLTISAAQSIQGHILCMGTQMTVNAPLTVTHNPDLIDSPPPGFERAFRQMEIITSSWKQLVN